MILDMKDEIIKGGNIKGNFNDLGKRKPFYIHTKTKPTETLKETASISDYLRIKSWRLEENCNQIGKRSSWEVIFSDKGLISLGY